MERAEAHGGLPTFVIRDFDGYLKCGRLEHGLVHLVCGACGQQMVVGFSCKRRGFCPSCMGRRMADVAAHLVEEVLPEVPMRQWVCSLPWRLRSVLGYDRRLCADVLDAFAKALQRSLRHRAKRHFGLRSVDDAHVGAVTFVQRSDSSLRLNVHFHTLAPDGVYVRGSDGKLVFHRLDPPSPAEVTEVARWTFERLRVVLARHGRSLEGPDDECTDALMDQPVLASCYAASAEDLQLLSERAGQGTDKLLHPVRLVASPDVPLAEVGGVNIHAQVMVKGRDRKRLEHLCRYIARPPLSQERLELHPDGRIRVRFKKPWRDGTHAVLLHPMDFLSRLCALVPPPRFHMVRYHGVFAANAKLRKEVVPGPPPPPPDTQLPLLTDARPGRNALSTSPKATSMGMAAAPRLRHRYHPLPPMRRPPPHTRHRHRPRIHRHHPRPIRFTGSRTSAPSPRTAPARLPRGLNPPPTHTCVSSPSGHCPQRPPAQGLAPNLGTSLHMFRSLEPRGGSLDGSLVPNANPGLPKSPLRMS